MATAVHTLVALAAAVVLSVSLHARGKLATLGLATPRATPFPPGPSALAEAGLPHALGLARDPPQARSAVP